MRGLRRTTALASVLTLNAGGSGKQLAVDTSADGKNSGGNDVYASDNDPELVREAIPFGLKTYEMMLEASPRNGTLLLAVARGYTGYAYLLQDAADRVDQAD